MSLCIFLAQSSCPEAPPDTCLTTLFMSASQKTRQILKAAMVEIKTKTVNQKCSTSVKFNQMSGGAQKIVLSVSVPEIKAGSGGGFIKASEFKDTTRFFRDFG